MIRNSDVTSPPKTLTRADLAIPQWTVSDELLTKFSEFNASADELLDCPPAPSVDGGATTMEEIRADRHIRQEIELQQAQATVVLFERRAGLLDDALEEMSTELEAAEASLVKSKTNVRSHLEKIGLGMESQVGWPHNVRAAETQFSHHIMRSLLVKKSAGVHHDWKNAHELAREYSATNKHNLAAARAALDKLVSGFWK